MSASFLTSLTEEEFKEFLKSAIKEIIGEDLKQVNPSPPDLLNVDEAALLLKYEVSTLYEKTSKKQIPHFKKGNTLYFDKNELIKWIKAGKVKTKSEIESEATTFLLNSQKRNSS